INAWVTNISMGENIPTLYATALKALLKQTSALEPQCAREIAKFNSRKTDLPFHEINSLIAQALYPFHKPTSFDRQSLAFITGCTL
ncbi:MAG: hypothetical protein PHH96_08815, partial [Smithellaceae bacterium]|nr:hypothetical protein [Smithellaceae bacterium]